MKHHFDLIVVGSGILGTAHAYHAAQRGLSVLLLEKDNYPVGSTVQNFGQAVPSGFVGKWQEFGRRATDIYKQLQQEFDISVRQNGSVYIASDAAEQQLIHELHTHFESVGYTSQLLTKKQTLAQYPALRTSYVHEALYFPQEVSVEPNRLIYRLIEYCQANFQNLDYRPNTPVIACEPTAKGVEVRTSYQDVFTASKAIVCSGAEFRLLFPALFRQSGIVVSKIQMLRTVPMPEVALEGNILTGLTIRRYESFEQMPSFKTLTTPDHYAELKRWGVHILFKKAPDGSIIIGDSHEYAPAAQVNDLGFHTSEVINDLMLREAERIVTFDVHRIAQTWAGFYAQHPNEIFAHDIENCIHIRTAIGGKGMTTSMGYAEAMIEELYGE
ncbi:MAG: TIGR03364 family FAD-dependent oxidoreductase [Runella sp.]